MASVRFGSIITGIKGSIGGTTYREFKGGFVAQKRSNGGNKTQLRENTALQQLNSVVQEWQNMDNLDRDEWQYYATQFQFPDRWGNLRNLNAREFFIKMRNQGINIGKPDVRPWNISDSIPFASFSNIVLSKSGICRLNWGSTGGEVYASVWANPVTNGIYNSANKKSKVLGYGRLDTTGEVDISTAFWDRFAYLEPGDEVYFSWYYYNSTGYRSEVNQNGQTVTA